MKAKIYLLLALLVCSGMLATITSASPTESSATLSSSGVVQKPLATTYSYIIRVSGSNYQMTDGTTGQIDYQSTNPTQVINAAIGNLTQGGSILVSAGTYNLYGSITGTNKDNVMLIFEAGATLFVSNGMNAPAIYLQNANNWLIQNPTINGNAAAQLPTGNSQGIYFWRCTNCLIDSAYIYNVRVFGFYAEYDIVNCGITNSKITDCGWNGITFGSGVSTAGASHSSYAINNDISHCSDVGITTYHVNSVIKNNYVHDMEVYIGGFGGVGGGTRWGIGVEGGNDNTITENNIINCPVGIKTSPDTQAGIDKGTADSNVISLNNITHSFTVGIEIQSSGNTISNNQIIDWDYASTWKNAITLESNTRGSISNNQMIGNTFRSIYSTACGVGVRTGVTNTLIQSNDFTQVLGTKITNAGTGTVITGNVGYP